MTLYCHFILLVNPAGVSGFHAAITLPSLSRSPLIAHMSLQSQGFIPIRRAGQGGVMLER